MAFFGAIIACVLTTALFARRRRLPVWLLLDAGALFATLPQAIGRLGNVVNGDILGAPSTLPWAFQYTNPHTFAPSTTTAYQPANVYELMTSLLLFGIVCLVMSRSRRAGNAGIIYVACYALSQLLIFFTRATEPVILFGLKQAQVTAVLLLLFGAPALIIARRRFPKAFTSRADETTRPTLATTPAAQSE